jgi:hypothetical protein
VPVHLARSLHYASCLPVPASQPACRYNVTTWLSTELTGGAPSMGPVIQPNTCTLPCSALQTCQHPATYAAHGMQVPTRHACTQLNTLRPEQAAGRCTQHDASSAACVLCGRSHPAGSPRSTPHPDWDPNRAQGAGGRCTGQQPPQEGRQDSNTAPIASACSDMHPPTSAGSQCPPTWEG